MTLNLSTYITSSSPKLQFVINLYHSKDSWGSAYAIDVVLYKPDYLTNIDGRRAKDVIRTNKKLFETPNDYLVVFKVTHTFFGISPHCLYINLLTFSQYMYVTNTRTTAWSYAHVYIIYYSINS